VAGREHEAVPVGPIRPAWIELEDVAKQNGGDVGHAHWHARVPRTGLLDGVHGERTDRVREVGVRHDALGCSGASLDHSHGRESRYLARRQFSTSRMIIGVRISRMARSSLSAGMTIELARAIQLPCIMVTR